MPGATRRDFLGALGVLGLTACTPVPNVAVPPTVPKMGAEKPELVVQ